MKIISFNINDKNQMQLFLEENTGEHRKEISEEVFSDLSDGSNHMPLKLLDGEIVVDETQLRINNISQELESTKWVVDEVNEYHANQEPVPAELLAILNERKTLKNELSELEDEL